MRVEATKLEGCFVIEPRVFEDERGYFYETYNDQEFQQVIGQKFNFVQDNESSSVKGVLRGLHYQCGDYAQAKLVRVIQGTVLDVAVDLRRDSSTFGEHHSEVLSADNKLQFLVPRGFAHGFVVLSDHAIFSYKCDNFYSKASEGGIIFSDPRLGIDWRLPEDQLLISAKDRALPFFNHAR